MEQYWIWFSRLPYVGAVTQKNLLQAFDTPENIYSASKGELKAVRGVSKRAIESMLHHRSLDESKIILENIHKQQIKLLTYNDRNYPQKVKKIRESPVLLYYFGELIPYEEAIAIVGARRCTRYGKNVTKNLATELAKQNIPVISGLAKGIDGYAHTACLKEQGYTLAFVASGVDVCYPQEHGDLYEQIKATGAVISSYPPGTRPHPKNFLERNGLISAWASQVVIVEAGEKSGALTTAKFAKEQGKPLFAVPHPIDSDSGKGSNALLASGARPFLDFSSLEISLNKRLINKNNEQKRLNQEGCKIMELLINKAYSVHELAYKLSMPEDKLREQLFELELEGKVFVRADIVSVTV